jgi:hypothetical protein
MSGDFKGTAAKSNSSHFSNGSWALAVTKPNEKSMAITNIRNLMGDLNICSPSELA